MSQSSVSNLERLPNDPSIRALMNDTKEFNAIANGIGGSSGASSSRKRQHPESPSKDNSHVWPDGPAKPIPLPTNPSRTISGPFGGRGLAVNNLNAKRTRESAPTRRTLAPTSHEPNGGLRREPQLPAARASSSERSMPGDYHQPNKRPRKSEPANPYYDYRIATAAAASSKYQTSDLRGQTSRPQSLPNSEPIDVDAFDHEIEDESLSNLLDPPPRPPSSLRQDPDDSMEVDPLNENLVSTPEPMFTFELNGKSIPPAPASKPQNVKDLHDRFGKRKEESPIVVDEDNDEIESAGGFPEEIKPPSQRGRQTPTKFQSGSVKNKVKEIESTASKIIPHFDLRNMGKGTTVARMKPRDGASRAKELEAKSSPKAYALGKPPAGTRAQANADSVLSESTRYTNKGAKKFEEILMPLKLWWYGVKIIGAETNENPNHWLAFSTDPSNQSILVRPDLDKTSSHCRFEFHEISRASICKDRYDDDFIMFDMKSSKGSGMDRAWFNPAFTDKPAQYGRLIFIFREDHGSWKKEHLERLCKKLVDVGVKLEYVRVSNVLLELAEEGAAHFADSSKSAISNKAGPSRPTRGTNTLKTFHPRKADTTDDEVESIAKSTTEKPRRKPVPAYGKKAAAAVATRQSSRLSNTSGSSKRVSPAVDEIVLVYPPNERGSINIHASELNRLEPGEYLNDTLIEFGLKYWLNCLKDERPDVANDVHVFSSFFYKKLQTKNPLEGYESVKKWTSRIDIFQKKYIIVPINENLHWYLAIIYHPEHVLRPASKPQPVRSSNRRSLGQSSPISLKVDRPVDDSSSLCELSPAGDSTADVTIRPPSPTVSAMSISGNSEREVDEVVKSTQECTLSEQEDQLPDEVIEQPPAAPVVISVEDSLDEVAEEKDLAPSEAAPQDDTEVTHIFTFDSLGSTHQPAIKTLKQYLCFEALDKKEIPIDVKNIRANGRTATVPYQPNFCDCGVFLLHFVETFMSDPDRFRDVILAQRKGKEKVKVDRDVTWRASELHDKRQRMSAIIQSLSDNWKVTAQKEKQSADKPPDAPKGPEVVEDDEDDIREVQEVELVVAKKLDGEEEEENSDQAKKRQRRNTKDGKR